MITIPDCCPVPTITSIRDGAWADPATWDKHRLPYLDDEVWIGAGTRVVYDAFSDLAIHCCAVHGTLEFSPVMRTRLTVGTLMVMETGHLVLGTVQTPIAPAVMAEIVIADEPLDLTRDPEQFWTGLIVMGRMTLHGTARTPAFSRLVTEPLADATALLTTDALDWRVGDRLFLPDSRQVQVAADQPTNREWAAIAAVNGRTIQLIAPLQFTHPGWRTAEGALDASFLPHVANLTRNVIIRSAAPTKVRGHVLFTGHADVDIRYAAFLDLGRTTAEALDVTRFDETGQLTHIGTNQIGRYALHCHHLFGPVVAPANGFQVTLIGNVLERSGKWAVAIHNTHYGLCRQNISVGSLGAAFVTEDGSESENVIEQNFAAVAGPDRGTDGLFADPQDYGHAGGFWMRSLNNYVRDNVAADSGDLGFDFHVYIMPVTLVTIPVRAGVDPMVEGRQINPNTTPIREFARNEVYGAANGFITWSVGADTSVADPSTVPESVIQDFRIWHVTGWGYNGEVSYSNRHTFDGLVIRGDFTQIDVASSLPIGLQMSTSPNLVLRGVEVQGMKTGLFAPELAMYWDRGVDASGQTLVEDSYFRNYDDIAIPPPKFYQPGLGWRAPAKATVLRRVRFGARVVPPSADGPGHAIVMTYGTVSGSDLIQRNIVQVEAFNGVVGDDFTVYYREQAATFVVPQTVVIDEVVTVGAPDAGLTNADSWAKYQIAIAGRVAPCAGMRPEIDGFVCPD